VQPGSREQQRADFVDGTESQQHPELGQGDERLRLVIVIAVVPMRGIDRNPPGVFAREALDCL
jgi:hypothetical protein